MGSGELQPVGPGELQPLGLGELHTVSLGELKPVSLVELQPLSLGELQPVSLGELQTISLGELQPVSLGELQPVSLGELQTISLGELQPVSLGELQPVSLLLHLLCLQWCKNAGPGSCQFFNLKQSSVILAFHKSPVFRLLCMQYLPAFEEDDAEWKNYPSATSCSYQCSKYIYFACVFVCICQRVHLFSKQQHLCVSWTNIRKRTFQRERG